MKRANLKSFAVALLAATVALVATAQGQVDNSPPKYERAPYWPALKPGAQPNTFDVKVEEWYSDIPWHQKLGSFAANEIMVPIIFPYEMLITDPNVKKYCDAPGGKPEDALSEEECMIEAGVANILGYHRYDTQYLDTDPQIKAANECKGPLKCTEVRLEISLMRAKSNGTGVDIKAEKVGSQGNPPTYGGFVLTDGSSYAPQMLWEMAHYCDSMWATDIQDPACYADYFSPFNYGFATRGGIAATDWLHSYPFSVFPRGDNMAFNFCKQDLDACVMALAAFNLSRVPDAGSEPPDQLPASLTYRKYNSFLLQWTNNALQAFPKELGTAQLDSKFPWNGNAITWKSFIYPLAAQNPFLGTYTPTANELGEARAFSDCDTGLASATTTQGDPAKCTITKRYAAEAYVYPRACSFDDLAKAAKGDAAAADTLRQCGINYEVHPNGWLSQWPTELHEDLKKQPFNYDQNEYGRTSFVFAGVRGMQMPVSFSLMQAQGNKSGLSVYEQVHNSSIFSLFLPAANAADVTRAMGGRNYSDTGFYHTLFMSNHMESDPAQFAEGIRGKVLWHNEYRMEPMYEARGKYTWLQDRWFDAAFKPLRNHYGEKPAPFHNNTCDGCHVRNGSGVPINTAGKLDPLMTKDGAYMRDKAYVPYANGNQSGKDYTFTGVIRPMKLVFFDLRPDGRPKTSKYSRPLNASETALAAAPRVVPTGEFYYNNAIMNFYGDSFHVSPSEGPQEYNYTWTYERADTSRLVVAASRTEKDSQKEYVPQQIQLGTFTTPATCELVLFAPVGKPWPITCDDIAGAAIGKAVKYNIGDQNTKPTPPSVGYMHLNGRRLGNLGAIEAIPNDTITAWQSTQKTTLGAAAGEIAWAPGTRDGVKGLVKKDCKLNTIHDCFIGRFGWLGDRGSLEDQVANAAFVEMNMTSTEGYNKLYGTGTVAGPLRYKYPNCGPANKTCMDSKGNSDLSELDIKRMADYGRWIGSPTRSEIQVSQPEVMAGESVFKTAKCDTCHKIERIDLVDPEQTVLSKYFRDRIQSHVSGTHKPFLSYIGTDLLMHDMGYLSQVGDSPISIRDPDSGLVKSGYEAYVQKIRTPALKGLRFNNYVTDAHRNTKSWDAKTNPPDPGCDFLLHDGRACNAIEAAFLHDGPAIKKLGVIDELRKLNKEDLKNLRAFLYSL